MPQIKTFWYDEHLAQSVLLLLTPKPQTTEYVAERLGLDPIDALSMLREMAAARRIADVTTFAEYAANRRTWIAAETPLI